MQNLWTKKKYYKDSLIKTSTKDIYYSIITVFQNQEANQLFICFKSSNIFLLGNEFVKCSTFIFFLLLSLFY